MKTNYAHLSSYNASRPSLLGGHTSVIEGKNILGSFRWDMTQLEAGELKVSTGFE